MQEAICEMKKASYPFGAVLVKDGKVVARGRSGEAKGYDPVKHAETNAIRECCELFSTRNLSGCTLYSTCEPCPMCFTLAWIAKVDAIVFGMSLEDANELYGDEIVVSNEYLNSHGGDRIRIEGGVCREEILNIMKERVAS